MNQFYSYYLETIKKTWWQPTLVGFLLIFSTFFSGSAEARYSSYSLTLGTANADRISSGAGHACAVNYQNRLYCWGDNTNGELGNGSTIPSATPIEIMQGVSSVAAGWFDTFAIKTDGSLWAWGFNFNGQLGNGNTTQQNSPVPIISSATPVRKVYAGRTMTCAVLVNGQTKCWGANDPSGRLGTGLSNNNIYSTPQTILATGVIDIALSTYGGGCAVKYTGQLFCWGQSTLPGQTFGLSPVAVSGASSVIAVSGLDHGFCFLSRPGGMSCWGDNTYGQIGNGTTSGTYGITAVSLPAAPSIISSSSATNCAKLVNGSVYCWGMNGVAGLVGVGTTVATYSTPTLVITSGVIDLATASDGGGNHCAIVNGGGVKCWGGFDTNKLSPFSYIASGVLTVPMTSGGGTISCAIKSDTTVNCWGKGYLGNGLDNPDFTNANVSGLTGVIQVGAGGLNFACALNSQGLVYCWGDSTYGQMGNGGTTPNLTPAAVPGLTGIVAIAVSNDHACALKGIDGTVYCWGRNFYGAIGYGTATGISTFYASPVRYGGSAVGGGTVTGVVAFGKNDFTTCVETANTYVYCAGYGYLDNGTINTSPTPILSIPGSTFIGMSAVTTHYGATQTESLPPASAICGINVLGNLWCWGDNVRGQLGNGNTTAQTVNVMNTIVSDVSVFAMSPDAGCAIAKVVATGVRAVGCWGDGTFGEMGDGTTTPINLTVHTVSGFTDYSDTLNTGNDAFVSKRTSSASGFAGISWGNNSFGELDNGSFGTISSTPVTMLHYPQ